MEHGVDAGLVTPTFAAEIIDDVSIEHHGHAAFAGNVNRLHLGEKGIVERRILWIGFRRRLNRLLGHSGEPRPIGLRFTPFETPIGKLNNMRAVRQRGHELRAITLHNALSQLYLRSERK
jgi:hypothetical protein